MNDTTYTNYPTASVEGGMAELGAALLLLPIIGLVTIVAIIGLWKVFTKAGKPGWAAIVPFYNVWVLAEIAGKPGWWGLIMIGANFIPLVGAVISLIISLLIALELAKKFGRSAVFGVFGLWLFAVVGYLIIGFGKDTYKANPHTTESNTGTPEIFNNNNVSDGKTETPPTQPPSNPPTNLVQ